MGEEVLLREKAVPDERGGVLKANGMMLREESWFTR